MQRTHQRVLSAKMRCGGTHPVSLSNFTHSGKLSITTVTTNPGFTAHWSSVLDNLCDWLTSVERVNWYISAGLVNSSNSVGDFRIPRSSCCSILGHPALSGHSLFPLWFGWHHCFPIRGPNRCRNLFHLSHFNIIAYSYSKIQFSYKLPSNAVPLLYNKINYIRQHCLFIYT
jgi:hypothetical protein